VHHHPLRLIPHRVGREIKRTHGGIEIRIGGLNRNALAKLFKVSNGFVEKARHIVERLSVRAIAMQSGTFRSRGYADDKQVDPQPWRRGSLSKEAQSSASPIACFDPSEPSPRSSQLAVQRERLALELKRIALAELGLKLKILADGHPFCADIPSREPRWPLHPPKAHTSSTPAAIDSPAARTTSPSVASNASTVIRSTAFCSEQRIADF